MFGNDLNFMADKADKKMDGGNLDVVAALMDVQTAEEGLLVTSANFDMLTTACENIEAGVTLADAIAAKGDETSAVIVARESLRQNLRVLGQEHILGKVVTPGTESITAATEGIGDMLKKAWAKTKEIAMKIWKWIVDLVSKVGHFLASLVGKGDTSYERLVKLVKKHKDAKTTNLDGQEFSESVQKALAKKFATLALTKNVDASGVTGLLESLEEQLKDAEKGKAHILSSFVDKQYLTDDGLNVEEVEKALGDIEKVGSLVDRSFTPATVFKINSDSIEIKNNDLRDEIIEKAEGVAGGDAKGGDITVVGMTFNKVYCIVTYVNDDYDEIAENLKEAIEAKPEKSAVKTLNAMAKSVSAFKVAEFTVTYESDDDDAYKTIDPLEFPEIESIKDSMKTFDKAAVKIVKNYGDKISKEKSKYEKALKTEFKTLLNDKDNKDIIAKTKTVFSALINASTKITKAKSQALVNVAKDMLASPVYDYCAESAKLYKKD